MTLHISINPKPAVLPAPTPDLPDNLYRVLHDIERSDGVWRKKVPEVFLMTPIHRVYMTEGWQRLTFDLSGTARQAWMMPWQ